VVVEEKQAVVLEQPKDQKVYLDIQHSTDLVAVGSIIISLLAFVVTIFIVCLTTKAQMKSNLSLIKSQKQRLDEELIFKNKQLITQNIIQYASKFISGQTNLIIKIRDFGVFYGYADQKDKLDRASHVGQLYQELRDISNQVLQDYHVLELFLLSKGRAIPNLEVKNRLFFNFLWRYLELLLDQVGSETMLKNQDTTIVEVLEHSEFKNIGLELKKALGEDNLTIYLILNELNRQMSKMIKTEIKKAA
jgi:hypothetical protein